MGQPIVDLATLDLTEDVVSEEDLRAAIPHAFEFRLIDGIRYLNVNEGIVVGYKDWEEDPWWARGHIPGRPLMPGVLMMEGSAQVATILMKHAQASWGGDRFIALAGVDRARFRGTVTPPARVYFVAKMGTQTNRIAKYRSQCFAGDQMVFEMELLGVPL